MYQRSVEDAARTFSLRLTAAVVRNVAEIESAIESFSREPNGGIAVQPNPFTVAERERIITLAARQHLPAVYPYRFFAEDGGLIAYGVDVTDLYQRAATYVDRILKGERPGELPIQQPTKFELVINLKTARALGITVPATLLASADEVIE
jgi:putative tryptophan/tyrosine transport system substrate-binding protein